MVDFGIHDHCNGARGLMIAFMCVCVYVCACVYVCVCVCVCVSLLHQMTGKKMRCRGDGQSTSSEASSDAGIDGTKPFSAVVHQAEDDASGDEGMVG